MLVIGGGVAGVAAALAARAAGRSVTLVRAGPGATALASGAWIGAPPPPFAEELAAAGHRLLPAGTPLAHPTGALYPAEAAHEAHAAAHIAPGTLVCGIAGLPGFHARSLAMLWGDAAGEEVLATELEPGPWPAGGWSPPSLAAHLEREPGPLADAVARAVRETGARRVILPAVLGVSAGGAVRAAVREAAGVEVAEALGVPPSIPGWRLDAALLAALAAAGVEVVAGRVAGCEARDRRVAAVRVAPGGAGASGAGPADPGAGAAAGEGGAGIPATAADPGDSAAAKPAAAPPTTIEARCIVLATGKFAGGGIALGDAGLVEPALGCPVWIDRFGQRFGANAEPLALTSTARSDPQPLLGAGVRTDAARRPVGPDGGVVYENVLVAGTARAGVETAAAGLGHVAGDGWAAGEAAAEAA